MISLLVAMDKNRVIGANNDLPWYLPNDLKYFKEKTIGNTIIMGRKTFESIGKALPNRENVVLSRQLKTVPAEVQLISDMEIIKEWDKDHPEKEFFVIGGAHLFEQILPYAKRMYITWIDDSFEGETYFPEFLEDEWILTSKEKGERDEKNPYDYYFLQYDRKDVN